MTTLLLHCGICLARAYGVPMPMSTTVAAAIPVSRYKHLPNRGRSPGKRNLAKCVRTGDLEMCFSTAEGANENDEVRNVWEPLAATV